MGTIELSHEMVVSAPLETVFAYLSNVDHFVELMTSLEKVRGHAGPLTIGASWQSVSSFMGRRVTAENRVLELSPPHVFRYETRSSAADGTSSWELQAVEDGTLVRHVALGKPKGFFASVAVNLLRRTVESQFASDMESLERRLNQL